MTRNCSIKGCNNKYNARGFCGLHYVRWKRHGDPLKIADPIETWKKISESNKGQIPWMKGKKHSEESRRKISESNKGKTTWNKGKKMSDETRRKLSGTFFKKGQDPWIKGKKMSDNAKRKLSEFHKGKKHSEETRRKMREFRNRPEVRKKNSESHKGKKHSEESRRKMIEIRNRPEVRQKMSEALRGKKLSEDTKRKLKEIRNTIDFKKRMSESHKGKKASDETRKKMHEAHSTPDAIREKRERRSKQVFPVKDSMPERIMQKALTLQGIKFQKHRQDLTGYPDIFIEPNICIFVDGDFWHGHPRLPEDTIIRKAKGNKPEKKVKDVREKDNRINQQLEKDGFRVIRFWDSVIQKDANACVRKILEILDDHHSI